MREYKIFTTTSATNKGIITGNFEGSKLIGAFDTRGSELERTPRDSFSSINFWRGKYLNVHAVL